MLKLNTVNEICIDHEPTGLGLTQAPNGSVVYQRENRFAGKAYKDIKMPHNRYTCTADVKKYNAASFDQLETDLRNLGLI
jgi:hypothetical protein